MRPAGLVAAACRIVTASRSCNNGAMWKPPFPSKALLLFLTAVLALPTGCRRTEHRSAHDDPQSSGYTVDWVGELRAVHLEGDARPRIHLRQIEPRDGTFAIGPLSGLRGEITVTDGEAYIARADDTGEHIERDFDYDAPFLVFGQVGAWQALPVPDAVRDVAGLEQWLSGAAAAKGLREDEAFPFKIETSTSTVEYHIISNSQPGDQVTRPHRELMRFFTIDAEPATILGVYSKAHGGVFTHHGQATHLHVVSDDERQSGHVDELYLGSDSVAYLPVP